MRKILNLLRGRRARLETDLDRELRYHFDRRVEDLRAEGRTEDEARKQAAIEMGGLEQVQEDVRETWTLRWLEDAARDARYAARSLARSPGFTITAVRFVDPKRGWITGFYAGLGRSLILRTEDAGATWAVDADIPGEELYALFVQGRERLWAIGARVRPGPQSIFRRALPR